MPARRRACCIAILLLGSGRHEVGLAARQRAQYPEITGVPGARRQAPLQLLEQGAAAVAQLQGPLSPPAADSVLERPAQAPLAPAAPEGALTPPAAGSTLEQPAQAPLAAAGRKANIGAFGGGLLERQPWTVACLTSCFGSVLSVAGLHLQQHGMDSPGKRIYFGDLAISREWLLGFLLVSTAGFPLAMFVYGLAPMSLIAPISGLTVVLNLVALPLMRREPGVLHYWPDLPASLLVLIGMIVTTYVSAHAEREYDSMRLWNRFLDTNSQVVLQITALLVALCMIAMSQKDSGLEGLAKRPTVHEMFLPAFAAAGAGLFANLNLKAAGMLMSTGGMREAMPWLLLALPPAAIQVTYSARGIQLYPQSVFLPIYSACLMLMITIGGGVFYEEFAEMCFTDAVVFATGALSVAAGIGLFAFRRDPEEIL